MKKTKKMQKTIIHGEESVECGLSVEWLMLKCFWTSEKRKRLTKCCKVRQILSPKCQK